MPKSLVVMGSGAIGIEFASFYRTLGAEVTVVEVHAAGRARRGCRDRGAFARKALREAGHQDPHLAKVTKVEKGANSVTAHIETTRATSRRSRPSG
jgi:dihydrolipoamide dehydrogenase